MDVQSEKKGEWWDVPDFETEINGDSRSTFYRGPFLVGSLARRVSIRDFCPALAALVSSVQNIVFLNGHFFSGFVPIVDTGWQSSSVTYLLTLSYSSKINGHLYPQRISLPSKKCRDMFSEGNADQSHPVGCDSPLQIVMADWCTFFEFELSG